MTREDLVLAVGETVERFNEKVNEAITLGRRDDAVEYAEGLERAARTLDVLDFGNDEG